jgi:hypothetical protein
VKMRKCQKCGAEETLSRPFFGEDCDACIRKQQRSASPELGITGTGKKGKTGTDRDVFYQRAIGKPTKPSDAFGKVLFSTLAIAVMCVGGFVYLCGGLFEPPFNPQSNPTATQPHVPERAESVQRPNERYYRDSHGAVVSESEAEEKLQTIRRKIMSMPDNAEKAFTGGVLKSLEEEWARIKRQGPVEQSDAPQSSVDATPRRGQINWTMAEKARRSWKEGNFRSADRAEQAAAMLVIVAGIKKAIADPLDRETTLDYVQRNIDSW